VIGATGKFPEGKIREDDRGEVIFNVGKCENKVILEFEKPTIWIGMSAVDAVKLASKLIRYAREIAFSEDDRNATIS
jgi:hypothetical protein